MRLTCALMIGSLSLGVAGCQTPLPPPMAEPTAVDLGSTRQGPEGDAFYLPPSPLPGNSNGDVIWARALRGAGALPSAAHNLLVLYRTTSPRGEPVAVSGAVAIPRGSPPPAGWPVLSWAHGTTGNAPQCAPTRSSDPAEDQHFLDAWVARGYAVVQTDYEGEGTPGIHPYFVGSAAARDVTDLVRAARALNAPLGRRWVALGHSEGGHASLFAGALGPAWAPELELVGAVAIAPASHITAAFMSSVHTTRPLPYLPLLGMMIQGMAVADPQLRLEEMLSPEGLALLPDLERRCGGELLRDERWTTLPASRLFREGADLRRLESDFLRNEPGALHVQVPVLVVQGESDELVVPSATAALTEDLCQRGAIVQYRTFPGEDHDSVLDASLRTIEQWVDARFQGDAPRSTCR